MIQCTKGTDQISRRPACLVSGRSFCVALVIVIGVVAAVTYRLGPTRVAELREHGQADAEAEEAEEVDRETRAAPRNRDRHGRSGRRSGRGASGRGREGDGPGRDD